MAQAKISKPAKAPTNPADPQALAGLRAQIDEIDNAIHDLLHRRADVVDEVRKVKGKQTVFIRPGREAQMLRALAARPKGKLPDGLIIRLWREIIGAFTLNEGELIVAVYAPEKGPDLWDVARDHFGSFTPLIETKNASQAVELVKKGKATLALVPPPADDKDAWWLSLVEDKNNNLTVFASAPFEMLKAGRSSARRVLPMGVVVGRLYPELTGDDKSFLALQTTHVPEAEIKRLLGKAGYKLRHMIFREKGRTNQALILVEVDGYVGKTDTRLSRLKAMLGSRLQHLAPMGGYPTPLKNGKK